MVLLTVNLNIPGVKWKVPGTVVVDGASYPSSTPIEVTPAPAVHTITVPESVTWEDISYPFTSWGDGTTELTKVRKFTADATMVAKYGAVAPKAPAIVPVAGTIIGLSILAALWFWG